MRKKRTTSPELRAPAVQPPVEAEWVTKMHDHFQKTGSYRPQDLERVLGDPRHGFEVRVGDPLVASTSVTPRK